MSRFIYCYAEFQYTNIHYTECRYAEGRGAANGRNHHSVFL
jgi:hypothetical protein